MVGWLGAGIWEVRKIVCGQRPDGAIIQLSERQGFVPAIRRNLSMRATIRDLSFALDLLVLGPGTFDNRAELRFRGLVSSLEHVRRRFVADISFPS